MALASREIDISFYNHWKQKYQDASVAAPSSRDEKLELVFEEIESDLQLVGVSAIEDKLQASNVHYLGENVFSNLVFTGFYNM